MLIAVIICFWFLLTKSGPSLWFPHSFNGCLILMAFMQLVHYYRGGHLEVGGLAGSTVNYHSVLH
jgi:hypothetical protein